MQLLEQTQKIYNKTLSLHFVNEEFELLPNVVTSMKIHESLSLCSLDGTLYLSLRFSLVFLLFFPFYFGFYVALHYLS